MSIKEFANSATGFTKSPLGIIALFIVLVYGFASLVVAFGQANLQGHIAPLVYFMVLFPVLVFFGFLWLVAKHHKKLYGPSDFKNEDNFLKTQLSSAVSLAAAISKQPGSGGDLNQTQLDEIVELVSKTSQKPSNEKWKNRILWVDDRPENNVHERQAFEEQGLHFKLALSTEEAIETLKTDKFAAIISDMGRKEGDQEGYVLLDKLRDLGNKTPFVIYAGSNLPEHKKMARERGAIGSTNRAQELFQLVMNVVHNGT
ncbi:response regulator [Vibrio cyclitrophicus]|uniref:response regulator n=1 Tax=Vibrio TaxID=662 RepID=UPI00031BEC81|nr:MULTISPECIES: response regulator [Vibrio]MBE8556416.1 response regulator [Vibrio sp. OPT24]OED87165.1 histidine kinase [Vibrio cyclitrophicus ZF30]OEE12474.1 histidine kinase [Vibrio cyclitrophicus ZF207]PMF20927.1 histidine kinase [Vibrio cyclitrophicus]PMH49494.1 histidine kinase [Vibrio cyclitrophicus]